MPISRCRQQRSVGDSLGCSHLYGSLQKPKETSSTSAHSEMQNVLVGPPGHGERRALPVGASAAEEVGVNGAKIGWGCALGAGPGAGWSIPPCISPPAQGPPSPGSRDAGLHPNSSGKAPGAAAGAATAWWGSWPDPAPPRRAHRLSPAGGLRGIHGGAAPGPLFSRLRPPRSPWSPAGARRRLLPQTTAPLSPRPEQSPALAACLRLRRPRRHRGFPGRVICRACPFDGTVIPIRKVQGPLLAVTGVFLCSLRCDTTRHQF